MRKIADPMRKLLTGPLNPEKLSSNLVETLLSTNINSGNFFFVSLPGLSNFEM